MGDYVKWADSHEYKGRITMICWLYVFLIFQVPLRQFHSLEWFQDASHDMKKNRKQILLINLLSLNVSSFWDIISHKLKPKCSILKAFFSISFNIVFIQPKRISPFLPLKDNIPCRTCCFVLKKTTSHSSIKKAFGQK